MVALGSKYGKIYVYEHEMESKCVHITAILAHHSSAVHSVLFHEDKIISCSDDMTIGLVTVCSDGALVLTKILQGHVSRVKTIVAEKDKILSGSDDRTVKLWTTDSGKIRVFFEKLIRMSRSRDTKRIFSSVFLSKNQSFSEIHSKYSKNSFKKLCILTCFFQFS